MLFFFHIKNKVFLFFIVFRRSKHPKIPCGVWDSQLRAGSTPSLEVGARAWVAQKALVRRSVLSSEVCSGNLLLQWLNDLNFFLVGFPTQKD